MAAEKKISVLHLVAAETMLFPILRDQLCFLRDSGFDIHTASIDGPIARRIQDDGFPWTPVPFTREIAPLADWRARRFIEQLCREKRFDIVHTHTPKANVVGQWAARRAGVPVVLQTLHGFYFHDRMPWLKRRIWIAIEKFSARHSAHVLCQNPEDVATAISQGIVPAEKITCLGNGIDLARFQPSSFAERAGIRARLGIKADAFVVGMVGRFVAEKGFPEFLAAGEKLRQRIPDLHLLAVGHLQQSERAGESWPAPDAGNLNPRLTILKNRDDMPALYAAMDVFVLPSHREGFPRALMEAAATGLPQIATAIRGCRQVVVEGQTGFLIPVGDVNALSDHIEKFHRDPLLRTQMGNAARAKAETDFDQQVVFYKVSQCYRQLIRTAKAELGTLS